MNYEDLYKLDRQSGGFSQQGIQKIRRITGQFKKFMSSGKSEPVKARLEKAPVRILIIKLWGMGNMVLAGRALKSIRGAYPNAHITLLTTRDCIPVYEGSGLYDSEMVFSCHREESINSVITKISSALHARMFDLAVNLDGLSNISAMLTVKSGARQTVGLREKPDRDMIYTVCSPYSSNRHAEDLIYDCALAAGGKEVSPGLISPVIRDQDSIYCSELIRSCSLDEHSLFVGININAGEFSLDRRWPLEKYALLAQMLEAHAEFRTFFFGSKEEERYVSRALSLMENPGINLAGSLDLTQTMAFLQRLHLLITNDSGLLHLAAALGVPTVSIFGPESPARVGRRDAEEHAVIYHPGKCSPCVSLLGMQKDPCHEGARCVRDISVEDVRIVVLDMLDHLADPVDPPWL
ncbi:MAG: glycosyltransferase family 9 protein [Planctomycetota bacterium]|jgi:ADP-heptose:LPS heptosyltransferase